MSEKFEIMEQRDEAQILAEAKGHVIKEMFYKFPIDGKEVVGISWVGTKEIARRYGGIKMGIPVVTDLGDQYACSVQATDTKNDVTLVGSSLQPKMMKKRDGSEVPDRFAYTKATSKAQRNAIRALIPESFLLEMEKSFSNGTPFKPPKDRDGIRKEVEAEFTEKVEPPVRPEPGNVKDYFEQLGYDPKRFTVWEDEPTGLLCIKIKGFFDNPDFRDHMKELGAFWDKDQKTYVVNL